MIRTLINETFRAFIIGCSVYAMVVSIAVMAGK